MSDTNNSAVKVWDLPVRLIHWALVVLIALSWATAEFDAMVLHHLSGYMILTLLLVRLVWGFAGSTTARFAHFLKGPKAIAAYAGQILQRPGVVSVGHNPLGALSVAALLGLLLLQAGLGLFAVDADSLAPGPLADLVTHRTGRTIAEVHGVVFNVLLGLIALHLAAVAFYLCYKRENLIAPMISGFKRLPSGVARDLQFMPLKWAVLAFAAALGLVILIAST